MRHIGDYKSEHVSAKTAKTCYCWRRHAGITRREAAEALNVGSSTLNSWESGIFPMSEEMFKQYREYLCGVYHCDPFTDPPKLDAEEQLRWLMYWYSITISDIAKELCVNKKTMYDRLFRRPTSPRKAEHIRQALKAMNAVLRQRKEDAERERRWRESFREYY